MISGRVELLVGSLREAGIPVSTSEQMDALIAVQAVGVSSRLSTKTALGSALVKRADHWKVFETLFNVYFAPTPIVHSEEQIENPTAELLAALVENDDDELKALARKAVWQFAAISPGRPVGGTYYQYRTLQALNSSDAAVALSGALLSIERPVFDDDLAKMIVATEAQRRMAQFETVVADVIRAELVADRGPEAVAQTVGPRLPENMDFVSAAADDLRKMQRAIVPLSLRLAARLTRRRKLRSRGLLDFRATIRRSLGFGGVPLEPKFRRKHPGRPEIVVLADISGSVANFARFTLQLVHALSNQFQNVRSFVFIDAIDEVTDEFRKSADFAAAIGMINSEANVVGGDGHSDYGRVFEQFARYHRNAITPKTSLLILGDARNNYHPVNVHSFSEFANKAKHVHWLNPEPNRYWDSGDSVIGQYLPHVHAVHECRTLKQLEQFVSTL